MRFSPVLLAAGLAAAAPASQVARGSDAVSMMAADVPQWTIENMQRACDGGDGQCTWSFGVQTNQGSASVPCSFNVTAGQDGKKPPRPASKTDGSGYACGIFTVSEGYSDQFGPDNGFTTLSVADFARRLIAYPAYTDKELAGNRVVSPNRSYQPQNF